MNQHHEDGPCMGFGRRSRPIREPQQKAESSSCEITSQAMPAMHPNLVSSGDGAVVRAENDAAVLDGLVFIYISTLCSVVFDTSQSVSISYGSKKSHGSLRHFLRSIHV